LRSLEVSKLVLRRDLSASVLHVEYELAGFARDSTVTLFDEIARWAEQVGDGQALAHKTSSQTTQ
jgi:hypothetical protein